MHLNSCLDHVEEVLSEVKEHKRRSLDQLHIDIVVCGGAANLLSLTLAIRLVSFVIGCIRATSHVGATGLALGLVRLFKDADVETKELSRQKVLDHLVVIKQWFLLKSDTTLQLVVL